MTAPQSHPITGPANLRRPNQLNGRDPLIPDRPLVTSRDVERRELEVADRQEHLAAPGLDELQHSRMATALAVSIQRLEWAQAALATIEGDQS